MSRRKTIGAARLEGRADAAAEMRRALDFKLEHLFAQNVPPHKIHHAVKVALYDMEVAALRDMAKAQRGVQ